MTKKLPGIFKSGSIGTRGNNKSAFYSYLDDRSRTHSQTKKNDSIDYKNNIESLINKSVEIKTRNATYITKIISKLNGHILTTGNDKIEIEDILDIKIKDRI